MGNTLTKMLVKALHEDLEPESEPEAEAREYYLTTIKDTYKEWLRTVELPDYYVSDDHDVTFNATESTRQLLITLVDEP